MAFDKISRENSNRLGLYESYSLTESFIGSFRLILISTPGWKDVYRTGSPWLQMSPSILILKPLGSQPAEGTIQCL